MDDLEPHLQSLSIPENELPPELIFTEILPRLPVKSLIRFKCVSKHWNSVISSPLFAKSHLQRQKSSSNPNHCLLLYAECNSFYTFDYSRYDSGDLSGGSDSKLVESPGIKEGLIKHELGNELLDEVDIDFYNQIGVFIVGSCDGLVCVEFGNRHLYLWNPATGESRKIENPPSYRKKETIWGFGYVSCIDDYKIVSVSQKLHSYRKKAHTLRVRGGDKWVKVDIPDGYNLDSRTYSGVLIDEMVFWRMINGVGALCVMGFDLDKEGFAEVATPEWMTALRDFTLCTMGGCLCVWWRNSEESRVEIAVLNINKNGGSQSWVKLYSFGYKLLRLGVLLKIDEFFPVGRYVLRHFLPLLFAPPPRYMLQNSYPDYDRLLPCPSINFTPRIEHLVILEEGPVCEYISKSLDLPPQYVADLIHFGAVFCALICPDPPPTATPEQVMLYEQFTSPELLKDRRSIKGKTFREAQKTFRVTQVDQQFEVGTYLRVRVHPKRFPRCYEIDWKSRILAVTESYVVLDKPAGTSVGGASDNIEESCVNFATRALELTSPLFTTHQIDNCTEGCVVLAKTKEYCSVFHKKIRDKMVKKLYLALAAAPIPRSIITHYMRPTNLAPRLISEESIERWLLCQLEVLDCKEVPWPSASVQENYRIEDCGWPTNNVAYECTVNLLTGRTHQIRAQFAACGAPLVGDSMYMPASLAEIANPKVNPFGKCKGEYASDNDKNVAIENWIALHGKEPTIAIGLQACQISWDNGEHVYNAGPPWWR